MEEEERREVERGREKERRERDGEREGERKRREEKGGRRGEKKGGGKEEGGGESEKNTYRDWSKISEGERVTDPAVLEMAELD